MRAVVCSGYGPPDRLEIGEVDQPRLARLVTGLTRPRQSVMGTEFAGYIETMGADVTEFPVGDAVFGFHAGAQAEYLTMQAVIPTRTPTS